MGYFIKDKKFYNDRYFQFWEIAMAFFHKNYDELFGLDNIFFAWDKFRRGKAKKIEIMNFSLHVEDNLFNLFTDFQNHDYQHSTYTYFQIFDNKKRDIHKAEIRDRVVHQLVYDFLYLLFNQFFITDSYASRLRKGQYRAINTLRYFIKLAGYGRKPVWILKCDVKKYFDNIHHDILLDLIREKVFDDKILEIIEKIITSYHSADNLNRGIPLGNITSQIFANIYLNSLDQYIKNDLKQRFFVRYNDDFVIVSTNKEELQEIRGKIILFARKRLSLEIPLAKTSLRKIDWGIDFLGFIILPKAILLRDKTKNKLYAKISLKNKASYFAILQRCDSYHLRSKIQSMAKLDESW